MVAGVVLTTNKNSQKIIYREKAIPILLGILKSHESPEVKVRIQKKKKCYTHHPKQEVASLCF